MAAHSGWDLDLAEITRYDKQPKTSFRPRQIREQ
jgi:hypothetical protein